MSDFVKAAKISEVSEGGSLLVEVDEQLVVLFHVDGKFYCIDDVCTHDGGPLSDGQLEAHEIACPRHGAKFDIRTGKVLTMPATQDTRAHEVKLDGDEILVRLNE